MCPPFSFTLDGRESQSFIRVWKHSVTQSTNKGVTNYIYTYTDPQSGLRAVCEVKAYDRFHAVDWVLRFENTGKANSPIISDVHTVDIRFADALASPHHLYYANGSTARRSDFAPREHNIEVGDSLLFRPEGGRSSSGDFLPFFNIVTARNQGVMVAIGWSGTWRSLITCPEGKSTSLQAGVDHIKAYLLPGERVRTASVCLLFWQGEDRMVGHNQFRRFLLEEHSRHIDGQVAYYPESFGFNWGDPTPCNEYTCLTTEYAVALMQRAKMFGIMGDTYWLDAGWYKGAADYFDGKSWWNTTGNWEADSTRFTEGLRPIGEYAHGQGQKFMVWFEPERVARGTQWAEKLPKDWLIEADKWSLLLNLGNPQALEWLCTYIGNFLEENAIDHYRQDFNIAPSAAWKTHDAEGREGITELKYIEGLYAFWDYLLQRFPRLLIDNCASGGRRLDYETTLRSAPMWRTDYQYGEHIGYQCHTYGLEFFLPQHGTGAYGVDPFVFRSSLGSAIVYNWKITSGGMSFLDMQKCKEEFRQVRPYYYEDFYPLTGIGDLTGNNIWLAYQLHRPSDQTGYVVAFRRRECPDSTCTVRLSGLDEALIYTLTDKDAGTVATYTAQQLHQGLTLTLPKPATSLLIKVEAKR